MESGRAVIGRTRVGQERCLKLTLVNPLLKEEQLTQLIQEIEQAGEQLEAESWKLAAGNEH
jgi:L-2,4-diaminobutyrate decarboxylase